MDRVNNILNNLQQSVSVENETIQQEFQEYKNDFYEMSIGSIKAIAAHAHGILKAVEENNGMIKENLTESWLQGKIAITEDYMRTIHDFIMFVSDDDDNSDAGSRPGLWDNIRKKKEKMGKDYKPAKPGDKDRPDPEAWKRLTKENKKK
jgi:hypothetical protein